jgi:tetrahydromethanopterin S-methyltransferase subunit B
MTLFSGIALGSQDLQLQNDEEVNQIEKSKKVTYVELCNSVTSFTNYFILPGTNTGSSLGLCLNPVTGEMLELLADGVTIVYSQSPLSIRVIRLESMLAEAEQKLDIDTKTDKNINEISEVSARKTEEKVMPPIQYVRICEFLTPNYFYLPGTDSCIDESTGLVAELQADGVTIVYSQSKLAHTVLKLEKDMAALGVKSAIVAKAQEDVETLALPKTFETLKSTSKIPVEYLKVCSLYGEGFYYVPDTDTCIFPTTGVMREQTATGVIFINSELANRIHKLEIRVELLKDQILKN